MKLIATTFGLGVFALGIAAAASSYDVKIYDPVWVGDTQLKKGDYKVEMKGDKAVFKTGKTSIEVPATVGKADKKFNGNSFVTEGTKLVELDLGGTTEKILFGSSAQGAAGSK
jgi:hypothetical protein